MERKRGRPRALNRDVIVNEALKLRPEEFTLPRVAEELGVSLPALYHYFPNKEALSGAMARRLNELVDIADNEVLWHQYLRTVLRGYRAFLQQSDYAFGRGSRVNELSFFRVAGEKSEKFLIRFNGFLSALQSEGLSTDQAVEVWMVFQDFVRHSVFTGATEEGMRESWSELQADLQEVEAESIPRVTQLLDRPCPDIDATFEAAVDVLVLGIAQRYGLKL